MAGDVERVRAARRSSVPICPGRRSSGGANSTGADAAARTAARLAPSPVALPITWSTGEPTNRRSRPRAPQEQPTEPRHRAGRGGHRKPPVAGVTSRTHDRCSSAPPAAGAVRRDRPLRAAPRRPSDASYGSRAGLAEPRRDRLERLRARRTAAIEPIGPWKHATSVIARGRARRSPSRLRSAPSHSSPIAFQYSSSWSREAVQAPVDRVHDRVACAARDRLVGIADLDPR